MGGLSPGISYILVSLRRMTVRLSKTGRGLNFNPKNRGKYEIRGTALLDVSQSFQYRPSPWFGLHNHTTAPTLNIAKILWQKLGHTVIIMKSGSHLRVQSWMQSCIQLCTGVKKIFLPSQLTYPLSHFSVAAPSIS